MPILRSPSADLDVTLAFAIVAVIMIQVFGFEALGVGYLTKFFNFREGAWAFVGILNSSPRLSVSSPSPSDILATSSRAR